MSSTMRCPNQIARSPSLPVARLGPGRVSPCTFLSASAIALSCPLNGASVVIACGISSRAVTVPMVRGKSPAQGVFAMRSTTHPPSLWVKGNGVDHLAQCLDSVEVLDHAHHLAMSRATVFQEPHTQRAAQTGRITDRGDISLIVDTHRLCILPEEMRPGDHRALFDGSQTHQLFALRADKAR